MTHNTSTQISRDLQICRVQDALLRMPIGHTGVKFGVVVTRWSKDSFEIGTWGRSAGVGSETAAEEILVSREELSE